MELLERLLSDFDIRSVFDASLGSGALAEACLRLGILYVGVTTSATHSKWLGNVTDNIVLNHMSTPGRPCYQKDTANEVKLHFSDVLVALEENAVAEDIDMNVVADVL